MERLRAIRALKSRGSRLASNLSFHERCSCRMKHLSATSKVSHVPRHRLSRSLAILGVSAPGVGGIGLRERPTEVLARVDDCVPQCRYSLDALSISTDLDDCYVALLRKTAGDAFWHPCNISDLKRFLPAVVWWGPRRDSNPRPQD